MTKPSVSRDIQQINEILFLQFCNIVSISSGPTILISIHYPKLINSCAELAIVVMS